MGRRQGCEILGFKDIEKYYTLRFSISGRRQPQVFSRQLKAISPTFGFG
jgi:hypothetical protein